MQRGKPRWSNLRHDSSSLIPVSNAAVGQPLRPSQNLTHQPLPHTTAATPPPVGGPVEAPRTKKAPERCVSRLQELGARWIAI